jgi:hypothetical protein
MQAGMGLERCLVPKGGGGGGDFINGWGGMCDRAWWKGPGGWQGSCCGTLLSPQLVGQWYATDNPADGHRQA